MSGEGIATMYVILEQNQKQQLKAKVALSTWAAGRWEDEQRWVGTAAIRGSDMGNIGCEYKNKLHVVSAMRADVIFSWEAEVFFECFL